MFDWLLAIIIADGLQKDRPVTTWSRADLKRLAEQSSAVATALRDQGIDLDSSTAPKSISIAAPAPATNTPLLLAGLVIAGAGLAIQWLGSALVNAGRSIQRHAQRRESDE